MDNGSLAGYIRALIKEDKLYKFYKSREWMELRDKVLHDNHYECARCMERGRYTRAVMVHHVNEVRKRPDLALTREIVDPITGEKKTNLEPLCFACHEAEHDRFADYRKETSRFTNEERW